MMTLAPRVVAASTLSALIASPALGQTRMPAHAIARLRPYVGHWNVEQVLVRAGGGADTTRLGSVIEFSSDSSLLIVRESTSDGRFYFTGYHTYDAKSQRFKRDVYTRKR